MKQFILLVFVLMFSQVTYAQWQGTEDNVDEKMPLKDRMFFGGGFGANFGSNYSSVSVSPLVGYRIVKNLAAGVQLQYRYAKFKQYVPNIATNDYGVSPFVRYYIYSPIFLHAEYEYLNYEYPTTALRESTRQSFTSFLAGGGYFQPIGGRAGIYLTALYNFSYVDDDINNPRAYDSPIIIRGGITLGF
jgi:hypothetical protein